MESTRLQDRRHHPFFGKLQGVSSSSHSAAPSALGYLYQSQWPLLELVRNVGERPDCAITIELHDDVAWDDGGTATELLQLKHRLRASGQLGDKSDDLWRTVRSWMDTHEVGDPAGPTLSLVTTQTAAAGSAAAVLRPRERDPETAVRLLEAAARDSEARATADTRARFLALPAPSRAVFVGRIYVLDSAPTITDLDDEIRRLLCLTLPRGHEDTFMRLLWSWWHQRVVDMLLGHRHSVSGVDMSVAVEDIRNQFTPGTLPTVVGVDEVDVSDEAAYDDRRFVHQLSWVNTPPRLIQKAVIDYYRAYTQTARWVDDDLVGLDELDSFEKNLRDEWEREFEWMTAELPADASDEQKSCAGRQLFRRTMDQTGVRIRERYDEAFFSRGKHHELADYGKVGWHPDFSAKLEELLLGGDS